MEEAFGARVDVSPELGVDARLRRQRRDHVAACVVSLRYVDTNDLGVEVAALACRDEARRHAIIRARAATSQKTCHSGRAPEIRRPGISGEKMMRRSVEVSVTPPGVS